MMMYVQCLQQVYLCFEFAVNLFRHEHVNLIMTISVMYLYKQASNSVSYILMLPNCVVTIATKHKTSLFLLTFLRLPEEDNLCRYISEQKVD